MTNRLSRLSHLERQAEALEVERMVAWVMTETRWPRERALAEVHAVRAKVRADRARYPEEWIPDADGLIDLEPHIRRLAAEYGVDPEELLQDAARWLAEDGVQPCAI